MCAPTVTAERMALGHETTEGNDPFWIFLDQEAEQATIGPIATFKQPPSAAAFDYVVLEPIADQVEADFEAMTRAHDVPLVGSAEDADALSALMRRPPPKRRALPKPLPLDE
jgi:hypothetical protein